MGVDWVAGSYKFKKIVNLQGSGSRTSRDQLSLGNQLWRCRSCSSAPGHGPAKTGIFWKSGEDFEIILVDDASSDGTHEIIDSYKDPRIKLYTNKQCLGIAKSRNKAIRHSVGKFIFCTDADCTVNKTWIREGKGTLLVNTQWKSYSINFWLIL